MLKIDELIREKNLIADGGMGTSIGRFNLSADDYHGYKNCPDYLVISKPDIIREIHASFLNSGSDIIGTDSFGANSVTLGTHGLSDKTYQINFAAAEIARNIISDFSSKGPKFVSGSIGPGSKLPSLRQITFDELKDSYRNQALGLIDGGVDLFQIETCQDILQAKAAFSGTRSAMIERKKKLPVILQVTLEQNGRMLLGTDISAVIATFSRFDLFALGLNCGTGPESMHAAVENLSRTNPFYCSVHPNAGLPEIINGKLKYSQTPEEFAVHIRRFVEESGVEIVGGCCGTDYDHITAVSEALKSIPVIRKRKDDIKSISASASLYICQDYDVFPRPLIIGERTNASGSKKFREALLKNDYDTMTEIALDQEKEGAHLLDLSLVYAGIDEMNAMEETVKRLAKYLRIPLCIDSTNPVVIEVALKNYGGKALINSINLEDGGKKAEKILDLALEYGASVIALTIDEKGMAKTCGRKIEIADRILNLTHSKGIPDGDVFIDFLTFPLGSGDKTLFNAGVETLNAVAEIKKQRPKVRTILGVSNISYGLNEKARRIINSLFLYHSVKYGIDAAIFHAGKVIALNQIQDDIRTICDDLIFNRRTAEYDPLEELIKAFDSVKKEDPSVEKTQLSLEDELVRHIVDGRKKGLKEILDTALEKYSPLEIINNFLLKGMSEVGELFGNGTLQLPFVLKSAEVMKSAADYLSINIDENEIKHKATVILATVKGDVHDIGKNLVDIILSNNGYKVYNLGIDCTPQTIADAALKYKGDYIGLSGLLVSSAIEMKNVAAHLNEKKINIPVFCGGAALNSSFVKDYLAPIYKGRIDFAKDAFGLIKVMKNEAEDIKIINENKPEKNILKQVNITNDYIRPEKPFGGVKHIKGIAFVDIEPFINKKRLFNVRWSEKDNEKALKLFNDCIRQSSTLSFDISYGYFDFPVTGFKFPRRPTEPLLSLEDFLKQDDFIAVFLATVGKNAVEVAGNLFKADSFSDYYHWYGFTAELTEALAEYINSVIRKELSINNSQGKRYSPGYSVWPDLNEQKKICSLLDSESIGVTLTENNQLVPELSVSGIFIYHPDAVYFNSVHSIQKKID